MKRVTVVTAGHLSTCPRMLKAADALAEEGRDIHVVATKSTRWASKADEDVLLKRRGKFSLTLVDYRRSHAPGLYLRSGIRHRLARSLAGRTEAGIVTSRAFSRVHDELVRAAAATRPDFFYGGTTGGLAATREAARRCGVPFALDLEDFHSGEYPEGSLDAILAARIEGSVLGDAAALTTSSDAIAAMYRDLNGVDPVTIHNTFPLPATVPSFEHREGPLRLYWFSQTVGPGRGIEQAVEACGLADVPVELHLRGNLPSEFGSRLSELVKRAPKLVLQEHAPAPPDAMTALCAGYDVGLALEQRVNRNRPLCITNKELTYPLAGLALAMTDTEGRRPLIEALEGEAIVCAPGDAKSLADGLKKLAMEPAFLRACRKRAWDVAKRRWHWEHPSERGKLLETLSRV